MTHNKKQTVESVNVLINDFRWFLSQINTYGKERIDILNTKSGQSFLASVCDAGSLAKEVSDQLIEQCKKEEK